MSDLINYQKLSEKNPFFNCNTIHSKADFDAAISKYSAPNNNQKYAFRGVKEAKYKMYSSAQRSWIKKNLDKKFKSMTDYVISSLEKAKQNTNIVDFFKKENIPINDFVLLALMQHYGTPSPLIDFSYNLNISLSFAVNGIETFKENNTIDDYFSIYSINYNQGCFPSLQAVNVNGAKNAGKLLNETDIPLNRIDASKTTFNMSNLSYIDNSNVPYLLVHGDKMGVTNIQIPALEFFCSYNITNPNLNNQEGLFILNPNEKTPLAEILKSKHKYIQNPLIDCLNIHKSLVPYIKCKYNINDDINSPKDLEANIRCWLDSLDI